MKRKLVLINLALAGLTAAAGWKLREQWIVDHQRTNAIVQQKVKPQPPPAPAPIAKPDPFVGTTYTDVAQKMLFSKDRNPNIIVEPPKPQPVKKMPPLPMVYGVMGLPSGMTAMMAERADAPSRGVHPGESVGEFKVVGITQQSISMEWDDKKIDKSLNELIETSRAAAPPPPPQAAGAAPSAPAPNGPPAPAKPGIDLGANQRACNQNDPSPAGTVADGFKKITEVTPFGVHCHWQAVQ